jgi:beta-xylosidase
MEGLAEFLGSTFDVYLSDDLVHWTQGPRVFSDPGPNVWAPEVYHDPDSKLFYLYFATTTEVFISTTRTRRRFTFAG